MKTYFDCMPCFIRQALDAARMVTDDEQIHEQVLREVLCLAGNMDMRQSPPLMGQKIHHTIRKLTGVIANVKNIFCLGRCVPEFF